MTVGGPRVLMGHPALNANVREAARALADVGYLKEFHTGLDLTLFARLPLGRLATEADRRALPESVHAVTHAHAVPELARLAVARQRVVAVAPEGRWSMPARHRHVAELLARRLTEQAFDVVYTYDDGGLEALRVARTREVAGILDLPTAYWRASQDEFATEQEINPEWASTMPALRDSREHLRRKDLELEVASHIVVASSYAKATLGRADVSDSTPIHVIPYGATPASDAGLRQRADRDRALHVLYVGRLSQAKGLSYLCDAVREAGVDVKLTVLGDAPDRTNSALLRALDGATTLGTRPHAAVLEAMRAHDVVVLPSLSDGFGLVLTEALSVGTPVIATTNTGAPDLLPPSHVGAAAPGWIVPVRDSDAIAEHLRALADDTDMRDASRLLALECARENTWDTYRSRIVTAVAASAAPQVGNDL